MRKGQQLQKQTGESRRAHRGFQLGSFPEEAAHVQEDVHVIAVQEGRPEEPLPLPLLRRTKGGWMQTREGRSLYFDARGGTLLTMLMLQDPGSCAWQGTQID